MFRRTRDGWDPCEPAPCSKCGLPVDAVGRAVQRNIVLATYAQEDEDVPFPEEVLEIERMEEAAEAEAEQRRLDALGMGEPQRRRAPGPLSRAPRPHEARLEREAAEREAQRLLEEAQRAADDDDLPLRP
jgi:hypothetical protein